MVLNPKLTIAVGAHPDDIELGCGGALYQIVKSGRKVIAVFMTKGEQSGDPEVRMKESRDSLEVLGVKKVYFGNFQDTEIPSSHAAIDFLEQFAIDNRPDLVLTHTVNDVHQDHRRVGWLSISAFRNVPKLLSYESPRVLPKSFSPTYFVDISPCVEAKLHALSRHESQKEKRYLAYQSMINLASFRGSQVGVPAAEAFEVVKYVERF